jgi:cytosine/uracil/thiamine/allantoin permease
MNERRLPDGRVELIDTTRFEASALYNDDLAPVPISRRTWSTYNYAALWLSMAHCIPTYMLASGLMASGINWSQAIASCTWRFDRPTQSFCAPLIATPSHVEPAADWLDR